MKRQNITFLLALLISMAGTKASAYHAAIDGIYYNFLGSWATVTYQEYKNDTYYSDYSGAVVIPASVTTYVAAYKDVKTYSVVAIDQRAFYSCDGLTSIDIPNSVTSIGEDAFYGCSGLTSLTIPNSVTSIGDGAFCYCSGLTSVTIPNSVTSIGEWAFSGCSSLPSVTIPNNVTSIGYRAFFECSGLTSITIPNGVISIGDDAFSWCSVLTSVTIPKSVTSIGITAFSGCSGLNSIKVETGNAYYDSRNNCNALIETSTNTLIAGCMSTIIPESVTSIGIAAFEGCSGLTSVTIPNSVTSIGNGAFYDCSGLTDVYCLAENVPEAGFSTFSDIINSANLYVPESAIEQYKAMEPWSGFGTILPLSQDMIDGIKGIGHSPLNYEHSVYDLSGRKMGNGILSRGINIVRNSDGNTRKAMVK